VIVFLERVTSASFISKDRLYSSSWTVGLPVGDGLGSFQLNPGNSTHGCHCSSSACASQNHFPHIVQRTVAGKPQTVLLGETAWHRRSLSSPSCDVSFIDTTLGLPFYRNLQFSINFPDSGSPLQMADNLGSQTSCGAGLHSSGYRLSGTSSRYLLRA